MHILVNDRPREVAEDSELASLAATELGNVVQGVALAVNGAVVPRSCWPEHRLRPGDKVLIVKAVQGG